MNTLYTNGRYFFAIGFIAFGIMHFIFGDFITGRAPSWPEQLSGKYIWAGVSGIILIATGVTILAGKWVRYTALLSASIIIVWALLRHIPIITGDSTLGGAWTQFGKALVFSSGILAIAGSFPKINHKGIISPIINAEAEFIRFSKFGLAFFLILCGIQHFLFVEFVASLMPSWFPWAVFWTYFAGICLIAGGVGLLFTATKKLAAFLTGLMIFSWVFIVHIPLAINDFSGGGVEWIAVFEAFAISGLAFYLTAVFSREKSA